MKNRPIYLDNSATTQMCDEAVRAYVDAATKHYGNPSSLHGIGVDAEHIMDSARREIMRSLYATGGHIIFTASGTEANNLAILGRARAKERFRNGARIIISAGEHPSVGEPAKLLESEGYSVTRISTAGGVLSLSELEAALSRDTVLVSIMLVNNETGAVYNIPEVAKLIKKKAPDAYLHVDATQGYLKFPFSPAGLGADMITVSAHKVHGPKGIGALYVSERVRTERGIAPVIYGGGQESGIRSGTENVAAIAAFGAAVQVGFEALRENNARISKLRERLVGGIKKAPALSELSIAEPPMHAPHIVSITLPSIKSETMLHYLSSEGIYVSSGSACSSNSEHKSEALIAYGRSEAEADYTIRVSLSHTNTEEDIDELLRALGCGLLKLVRLK